MAKANKVKPVAKCYSCSEMIMSNEDYTALTHKQKGHEVMAVAHTDWTGCQKAINRPKGEYEFYFVKKQTTSELVEG